VKQLVVGRLDMTPNRQEGFYTFAGTGTIEPLIAGVVPHARRQLLLPVRDNYFCRRGRCSQARGGEREPRV